MCEAEQGVVAEEPGRIRMQPRRLSEVCLGFLQEVALVCDQPEQKTKVAVEELGKRDGPGGLQAARRGLPTPGELGSEELRPQALITRYIPSLGLPEDSAWKSPS